MKIKLLPMAIGAILAAQFNIAQAAEVQVYGKANISVNANDEEYLGADKKDNQEVNSNASRIGVKGDLNITEELKAIYKFEYEVYLDDGDDGTANSSEFNQRNIYGGLQHKTWGQLIAGKNDTPLKLAQGEVDRFNDLPLGDINQYMVGENRMNNIVMYSTPKLSGFTFSIQGIAGEASGVATTGVDYEDDGLADSISTALQYETEMFTVALSMDDNVINTDTVRGVGSVKLGPVTLGVLAQKSEAADTDNDNDGTSDEQGEGIGGTAGTGIGGALKLTIDGATDWHLRIEEQDAQIISALWDINEKWAAYAQLGQSTSTSFDVFGGEDFDADFVGVGVDYKLSKKVKVYAYATQIEVDVPSSLVTPTFDDGDFNTMGTGLEIKF